MKAKILRVVGLLVLFYAHAVPVTAQTDQATRLELADSSRCLTCHDVIETIRGPAWQEVAKRYLAYGQRA